MGVTGRACANTCLASPFQCFRASMNGAQRPEVAAPSARQACLLCGPKVSRGLNEFPDSESAPIYGTRQTHSHVHGMAVGGGEWFDEFPRVSSSCLNSRWRVDSNASGWRELVTACKGGVWWKGAIEREGGSLWAYDFYDGGGGDCPSTLIPDSGERITKVAATRLGEGGGMPSVYLPPGGWEATMEWMKGCPTPGILVKGNS